MDEAVVRSLLREQRPEWADLAISLAGAGTDNTMYRLGDQLLIRLPRTAGKEQAVRKEQSWLPRLAPHLSCRIPELVHAGTPGSAFPLALVGIPRWYRGGGLPACDGWVGECFDSCPVVEGLDIEHLRHLWQDALALPGPSGRQVWLHGDLKPTNLLTQHGKLHAVIDFGGLSVGFPDAEHAPVWDLPPAARQAYWDAMSLDDVTWLRARAWAIAVGVSGLSYYWDSYPAFVSECRFRLGAILEADVER